MAEKHHAPPGGLMNLLKRYGILVELHSEDLGSTVADPLDPAQLRTDPVHARSGRKGVPPRQGDPVVIGFGYGHAGPNGVTAPQESSEIGTIGNPQWSHDQVIGARDRGAASSGGLIRTSVPPAQRVRNGSSRASDELCMSVGLRGVRGPSLSKRSD